MFAFLTCTVRFPHNECMLAGSIECKIHENKALGRACPLPRMALRLLLHCWRTRRKSLCPQIRANSGKRVDEPEHELPHLSIPGLVGIRDRGVCARDPKAPLIEMTARRVRNSALDAPVLNVVPEVVPLLVPPTMRHLWPHTIGQAMGSLTPYGRSRLRMGGCHARQASARTA